MFERSDFKGSKAAQSEIAFEITKNSRYFFPIPSKEFCGMVKNRNGKYIRQLSKTDVRYSLLQSIPKPKDSLGGKVCTGLYIIELRVDIKKTIENMNYHFSIVRVFANDSTRKCYQMVHLFQKHDYLKRNIIISNEICEYL